MPWLSDNPGALEYAMLPFKAIGAPWGAIQHGIAGGNPLEALADPDVAIRGRPFLEKIGLVGRDSGVMGDVAGTAVELADPISWFGLGALGKGLQAMRGVSKVAEAAPAAKGMSRFVPGWGTTASIASPLAGTAVLSANARSEHPSEALGAVGMGLELAPLAHGGYNLARGLASLGRGPTAAAPAPKPTVNPADIESRRGFLKGIAGAAASAGMNNPLKLAKGVMGAEEAAPLARTINWADYPELHHGPMLQIDAHTMVPWDATGLGEYITPRRYRMHPIEHRLTQLEEPLYIAQDTLLEALQDGTPQEIARAHHQLKAVVAKQVALDNEWAAGMAAKFGPAWQQTLPPHVVEEMRQFNRREGLPGTELVPYQAPAGSTPSPGRSLVNQMLERPETSGTIPLPAPGKSSPVSDYLYHVTARTPDILASGELRGATGQRGGFGHIGSDVPEQFVSTTTDAKVAANLQRELTRRIEAAKGQVDASTFDRWAREDEIAAGIPEHSLDTAARRAKVLFLRQQRYAEEGLKHAEPGQYVTPWSSLAPDVGADAHNAYLWAREHYAKVPGDPDPIILGGASGFGNLDPANVSTFKIPTSSLPIDTPLSFSPGLSEMRVHGKIPVGKQNLGKALAESMALQAIAGDTHFEKVMSALKGDLPKDLSDEELKAFLAQVIPDDAPFTRQEMLEAIRKAREQPGGGEERTMFSLARKDAPRTQQPAGPPEGWTPTDQSQMPRLLRKMVQRTTTNPLPFANVTPREAIAPFYANIEGGGGIDAAMKAAQEYQRTVTPDLPSWRFSLLDEPIPTAIEHKPEADYSGQYNRVGKRRAATLNTGTMRTYEPMLASDIRDTLAHEVGTHGLQQTRGNEKLITAPHDDGPRRYLLGKEETEANVIAPAKRLYAQATGKLVRTPQDAEDALAWLARHVPQTVEEHKAELDGIIDRMHNRLITSAEAGKLIDDVVARDRNYDAQTAAEMLRELQSHRRYDQDVKPYLTRRMPGILSVLPWMAAGAGAGMAASQGGEQ